MQSCQIVQLASLGEAFDAELARRYRVLPAWRLGPGQAPDARLMAQATVAVTSVRHGMTRAEMDRMPSLRAICSWGVGYDTLDIAAAMQRGLQVSNTPHVLDDCVADLAWSLLLAVARRTAAADRYVKQGRWQALGEFPLSTRVSGKRLGILGLGRIGAAIARRGAGFDMQIRYHGRRVRKDVPYGYEPTTVALAQWADFLVVSCVGGPETRNLVDACVLRALGPRGILVNVSRGTVVDQAALLAALRSGELGGAGLDVLEQEPSQAQEFADLDQVVLTPHVGSATHETRQAMADLVMRNVQAWFESGRLLTPVES
jgi:Lactate dehydrogenase and related dehydrogenases